MNSRQAQFERNKEVLKKYIPETAVEQIAYWIVELDFKLKIKRERSTRLGDYTSPRDGNNHLITINYNLNQYAFLITLVHEIAHLVTFNEYKNRVMPHGVEWKKNFQNLMTPFLSTDVFPVDLLYAVRKYLQNPAAASCSDNTLLRALKLYDKDDGKIFLEHLPYNCVFLYNGERVFEKGEKIRTRFRCREVNTGTIYLFNALTEVEIFEKSTLNEVSRQNNI
jgi:hypothetical protein